MGTAIRPRLPEPVIIFVAIGGISTPAYVRLVLRELTIGGRIIATGQSWARVYRRLMPQMEIA